MPSPCLHPLAPDAPHELSFTRVGTIGIDLGPWLWTVWALLLLLCATNAVNLTDGLDGLAAGSSAFSFAAYVVIGFWAFRHPGRLPETPHALDLAVVAAAMVGACTGFLWWNAAPARSSWATPASLAIGAGLAGLALDDQHGPAAADHRRHLRRRDRVGDHPGGVFRLIQRRRSSAWRPSTTTSSWAGGRRRP